MADYLPPTENLPIFDTTVFDTAQNQYLTYNQATGLFLTYPIAQGDETLQAITVQGPATFNSALVVSNGKQNTSLGNGYLPLASGQGNQNVVIGVGAGASGLSGDGNTIVGYFSASQGMTSGAVQNVLYGSRAGQYLTSGQGNTLIGTTTYNNITTGNANICLGNGAMGGESSGSYSNNIIIGNGIVAGGGNKTIIGTTTQDTMELRVKDIYPGTISMNNNLSMNNIISGANRQISSTYYNFYATNNNTSLTYSGRIYGSLNSIVYDCPDTNASGSSNHTFYCYNGVTPLNSLNINNTALTTNITQPAYSDTSNKIPTTAWVQGAISTGSGVKNMWNYQIFNVNSTVFSGTGTQIATINTPLPSSNQFSHIIRLEVSYAIFVNGTNTLIPSWALIPGVCTSPNPNTITIFDCIFDPSSQSYYPVVTQSTYVNVLQPTTYAPPNQSALTYTPIQIGTLIDLGNNIAKLRVTVNCPLITYQVSNYKGNLLSFTASIKIVSSQNTSVSPVISGGASAGISYFS